jgi:putative transposase
MEQAYPVDGNPVSRSSTLQNMHTHPLRGGRSSRDAADNRRNQEWIKKRQTSLANPAQPSKILSMSTDRPIRKHPAHLPPLERADRPTVIMVTTCVTGRRSLLAREEIHTLLRDIWRRADHWQINRYVIMPDHLHFFCCPANPQTSYKTWRQFWRSTATREWSFPAEKPIWQRDDWDTQIRSAAHFTENGITSARIPSEKAWLPTPTIGRIGARSFRLRGSNAEKRRVIDVNTTPEGGAPRRRDRAMEHAYPVDGNPVSRSSTLQNMHTVSRERRSTRTHIGAN